VSVLGRRALDGRSRAVTALVVIVAFVGVLYVVELVDALARHRLDAQGIEPREADGLDGIVWAPLLHASWSHLLANTLPLLVLGFLLLLGGITRGTAVTAVVWVVGGVGTWLVGPPHTVHLGASVLAFGWLAYLLLRGVFSRRVREVLLAVVLFLLYGTVLLGVLPGRPGISWQGHLFGAIGGALAAWWFGRRDQAARVPSYLRR
jgi:membrane associated rhomboid family serine protease